MGRDRIQYAARPLSEGYWVNVEVVFLPPIATDLPSKLCVAFICSGDYLGSKFAIDDAFTAGYLATLLQRESAGAEVALEESAVAAVRLYRSYLPEAGGSDREAAPPREAILRAFWESHNAEVLSRVGLAEDVEYCAQVDISSKVPRLRMEEGMLVLV